MSENKKNREQTSLFPPPALANMKECSEWIIKNSIDEVECIAADISGIARGKSISGEKFAAFQKMRLPQSAFMATVSGGYIESEDTDIDHDLELVPDEKAIFALPWLAYPALQVIHDINDNQGRPVDYVPRNILKKIIGLYEKEGWQPVVAPEMEFYLVSNNPDPDEPLEPPAGRSGRSGGSQAYSVSAIDEYVEVIEQIHHYAEMQGIALDSIIQEAGPAQMEINLPHGDPLKLADHAFVFKRTIREAALQCGFQATFMAKPMQDSPGSAMHIHQSVIDKKTGDNIFSQPDGTESEHFRHFIGGLQKFTGAAIILIAPYVNSYRRLVPDMSAPVNLDWGLDNRTTGLRIPSSRPEARRVENRVAGADANPYLAIATTLACGYLGMINKIEPEDSAEPDSAYGNERTLAPDVLSALRLFSKSKELRAIFGDSFVDLVIEIKQSEYEEFFKVVSPWEREFLMMTV